ncbi:hypothetical protein PAGU2595_017530 [Lysobacter xanthus]
MACIGRGRVIVGAVAIDGQSFLANRLPAANELALIVDAGLERSPARRAAHMDVRRMHPRQEPSVHAVNNAAGASVAPPRGRPFFWLSFLCASAKKSNSGAQRTKRS